MLDVFVLKGDGVEVCWGQKATAVGSVRVVSRQVLNINDYDDDSDDDDDDRDRLWAWQ